ncbi:hypothetical protein MTO96_039962 [Rhipicephalus appendiculatus]
MLMALTLYFCVVHRTQGDEDDADRDMADVLPFWQLALGDARSRRCCLRSVPLSCGASLSCVKSQRSSVSTVFCSSIIPSSAT